MDFAAMFQTWQRVLTQPGEPVFLQEKENPNGTLQTALIWMLIAGVVAAIFGFIASAIGASSADAMLSQAGLPPDVEAQMRPMIGAITGTIGWGAIITVPLFFLIGTFILHLIAGLLGGQGEYSKFAYLVSTYQAPLTIAGSIFAIIPFLGGCVSLIITIYSYVETFFAVKAHYGLTSGRALAVVLIPLILLFVLLFCFVIVVIGGIAAISGGN
jgi:hypothetical protein